jgi:hypothetical protein
MPSRGRAFCTGSRALALGLGLMLACGLARATPDEPAQHEIDHLLEFIAASNCTFVRNGESFPAAAAADHLQMKYSYTKFRLSTADEFVKYLATGSSSSGEPYKVICDKRERPTGAWLAEELARFRRVARTGTPPR